MSFQTEKTLKILIVEDDLIDRKQMERLLSGSSIPISEVKYVEYLDKAFELLCQEDFDIVLLDLNLPDINGLDTLTEMTKRQPNIAKIAVIGEGGEELGLQAIAKGAQNYIVKGEFDTFTLTKSISSAIELKRTGEELAIKI